MRGAGGGVAWERNARDEVRHSSWLPMRMGVALVVDFWCGQRGHGMPCPYWRGFLEAGYRAIGGLIWSWHRQDCLCY
jgi:hypothetical protein